MASPPISGSTPRFSDANACKQWLNALPLTNVPLVHATLTAQLELLNRTTIAPLERLKISELLRNQVAFVQMEMARKYLGKPLPLETAERDTWNSVDGLWAAMSAAYRLSLQDCVEDGSDIARHVTLIAHRCLRYTGLRMMENCRIYREPGKALWRQAHELFALAEQRGFAADAVKDSLNEQSDSTSCTAAYAQILLTHLADPYRLTSEQLNLLDRWLDKWAVRVTVATQPPEHAALPQVAVDLAGTAAPHVVREGQGQTLAKPRYLDMERLAATFQKRIKRLRKGGDPVELGLGKDCTPRDCENLLVTLYQHWCQAAPAKRDFTRRAGADKAQTALGMAAIHFFLGGEQPFKQPGEKEKLSQREIHDLQFFGRISEKTEKHHVSQLGFGLETWQIQDESALGFRLIRPDQDGMRIRLKQLIAVRPTDSSAYALGVIKWLIFPLDGGLHIGVRILPGLSLAVAARPLPLIMDAANKYTQAFLLSDMPVLREAASLVLPPGWFGPGRLVEIRGKESQTVKLLTLIEKGNDYERVGFERQA